MELWVAAQSEEPRPAVPELARLLLLYSSMPNGEVVELPLIYDDSAPREARVRAALERVERGVFGLCIECGGPVERGRLDHSPLTERCSSCCHRRARPDAKL